LFGCKLISTISGIGVTHKIAHNMLWQRWV
jgi:hypothetical protein